MTKHSHAQHTQHAQEPSHSAPPDSALLERWRAGDASAGEALFERYYNLIERFFINKVGEGIDDLIQETFTACLIARDRIRETTSFRSYLFAVAHNILCAHLRKKYRRSRSTDDVDFESVSIRDLSPGPSSLVGRRREHRVLLEALRSIPVAYQVLIELHYWEHLTTAEMATILAIPVGTCRSRLVKARDLLATAILQLENAPNNLTTTLTHLEDWASQCRDQMDG